MRIPALSVALVLSWSLCLDGTAGGPGASAPASAPTGGTTTASRQTTTRPTTGSRPTTASRPAPVDFRPAVLEQSNADGSLTVRRVLLPEFPGACAIWGATGMDRRGHVWFGVSADRVEAPSARLYEYLPREGRLIERGDVTEELRRLGLLRPGESQMKIHSKIHQAADGNLYFASMDERGEDPRGGKLPDWGGHLWRLRLPENRWQHLMSASEGLIGLTGTDSAVYALGYWGHKLYRYDLKTGRTQMLEVGSVDGHVSRNLFTDAAGHVFVPRLEPVRPGGPGGRWRSPDGTAALVEFDPDLREVGQTPLDNYLAWSAGGTHGITAFQPLKDGRIAFLVHTGRLYVVEPSERDPAKVADLGWFNPQGGSYATGLFLDGTDRLVGLTQRGQNFEWVTFDVATRKSSAVEFVIPQLEPDAPEPSMLYGCTVRDAAGDCYIVGAEHRPGRYTGFRPILLKVRPATLPPPASAGS